MPEPALEVEPPTCDCGGLIRPDIVWFGEPLPEETVAARGRGDDRRRPAGRRRYLQHRVPGGEPARIGAGARHGRHRGQSGAHAAVRQRHDHRARNGQQGAADTAAAAACPAELSRTSRPAEHELRHRQRRPRRQRLLDSGTVHVESRGADRPLGVAVSVAVTRQPRPDRRVDQLLEPAPDPAGGHMLQIAQLTARPQTRKQFAAEPNRGRSPSTAPASTPPRQTARSAE